jgi:hypothetical protein
MSKWWKELSSGVRIACGLIVILSTSGVIYGGIFLFRQISTKTVPGLVADLSAAETNIEINKDEIAKKANKDEFRNFKAKSDLEQLGIKKDMEHLKEKVGDLKTGQMAQTKILEEIRRKIQ